MAAPWDRRQHAEQSRVKDLAAARWLPSVLKFSPHWAAVGESLHLPVDEVVAIADLDRFPTSRERELLTTAGTAGADLVLRPNEDQIKSVATTSTLMGIAGSLRRSGTDGLRRALLEEYKPVHVQQRDDDGLAIAYSRRDLDRLHLTGARAAAVLGLDENDYIVSALPAEPSLDFWGCYHLGLGASILALHPRGHGDDLDVVVPSLRLVPTTAIAVRSAEATQLARLLARARAPLSRLRTVIVFGPVLDGTTRAAIADAFRAAGASPDVAVLGVWGPPDGRSLWAEQRGNPGSLVTYADLEHLEVVDPLSGLPTDGPGDLTITTIGWTGTALVRYQTGVWVGGIEHESDPVTGRTPPRLIDGQQVDAWTPMVTNAEGTARRVDLRGVAAIVHAHDGVATWLFELRPATQRIRQDRLVLELGGDVPPSQVEAIEASLPDALGSDAATIKVTVDPTRIDARVAEAGSRFIDLR